MQAGGISISVVIVVRNEYATIEGAVRSVLLQEKLIPCEILLVDSASDDGTERVCTDLAQKYDAIRHVRIPHKGIGYARKVAAEEAQGAYVAFLDGDCRAPVDWLTVLWDGFQRNTALYAHLAAVGGSHTAFQDAGKFAALLGVLKTSPFASGSMAYTSIADKDRVVEHLPTANVLYSRAFLEKVPFDPAFSIAGEDIDVSTRGTLAGYVLVQTADSYVEHKMQPTLLRWIRSMQKYGYGRMQWMLKVGFRTWAVWRFFCPLLLPLVFVGMLFWWLPAALWLLAIYTFLVVSESLRQAIRNRRANVFVHLCYLFPVTHGFFALGQYRYLVRVFCKSMPSVG